MSMFLRPIAMLAGLLACCGTVMASDLAKEKRWAEQIVDALFDGEAIYLNDGRNDFLAILTEAQDGDSKRGAVVMHGSGVHPDWPTVVHPLRVELTAHGWHTLSIQMPILANDADAAAYTAIFPHAPARIEAAIRHLREELGVETVVLVAHSLGASMTTYHLAHAPGQVDGFVAIGLGPGGSGPVRDNLANLAKIKVPVLDLYGSQDLPVIVASAGQRRAAAAANPDYTQLREDGADHFFDGEEQALVDTVNGWLQQRF